MNDIGLIGLGVMGKSLALNIANNNYNISVYNHRRQRTDDFLKEEAKGRNISGFYNLEAFTKSLSKPRKIILMTAAGNPVDEMINGLTPFLEEGDLIIDGGNTHFPDTSLRLEALKQKKIHYLGVGISGGESGALNGPSIMPGGTRQAYEMVKDILVKIAADGSYGPCCTYIGDGSAGHFVKMIHNGIEYAMMQAISEVYHILRKALKLDNEEISHIFEKWNHGVLDSYLMEITYKILRFKDEETDRPLIDLILDKAGQKGTGKWTAQTALDLGIPTPSLNVAVESRTISFFKEDRVKISKLLINDTSINDTSTEDINKEKLLNDLENTLIFTNILIFSQGLWLMSEASKEYNFDLDISEVLKIWTGGCIIRARLLDYFVELLEEDKDNVYLLNSERNLKYLFAKLQSVKDTQRIAMDYYIPCFVINSSLDYLYGMSEANLPANLIQAQRDFFGAHTYNRIDEEGVFHTIWE